MEPQTWTDYFVSLMPTIFIILLWLIPVLIAFGRLRNHALDDTASARTEDSFGNNFSTSNMIAECLTIHSASCYSYRQNHRGNSRFGGIFQPKRAQEWLLRVVIPFWLVYFQKSSLFLHQSPMGSNHPCIASGGSAHISDVVQPEEEQQRAMIAS